MISKLLAFKKLSSTLIDVLTKRERKVFLIYLMLSVFNTILEIISISIIILLLLIISGQDVSNSNLSILFETIPFEKNIFNISYLMILIVMLKTIFQIIFNYNQEKISYQITKRINVAIFEKFINSKYKFYITESSPKIIRILNQDSIRIGNQLISPFITLINESFLLILILLFIFFYDPILGLGFYFITFLLLFSFNISINKIVQRLGKKLTNHNTSRIKLISDTFKGFDIIKLFNRKETFTNKFDNLSRNLTDTAFKNLFYLKLPKSIFELVIFIIVFLMIIILVATNNEKLLLPYLSVSAVTIYKIIPSLNKLSNAFQGIQYFSTPFREIVDYLKIDQEELHNFSIKKYDTINYDKITFQYEKDLILENIDFQINQNDFIGIYGHSGSGKSTLIKILSGLMTPDNGEIFIDNKQITPMELRAYCSYVPQDSVIFDEDISTNISLEFNSSKINNEKVVNVLKKVDLYEKFKGNFKSHLGESGIKISGGQKQRIAIARALYHNKSILILDESTSNLDIKTEQRIIDLLKKISSEISVIIVSHKESSLEQCNVLYEINKGKINKRS